MKFLKDLELILRYTRYTVFPQLGVLIWGKGRGVVGTMNRWENVATSDKRLRLRGAEWRLDSGLDSGHWRHRSPSRKKVGVGDA